MHSFNRHVSPLPRILLPLLAGMLALTWTRSQTQAAEPGRAQSAHSYIMPADDGYGITECIAMGGACARVVADAWCEAHGHAQAIAFGRAEDATASIIVPTADANSPQPGSYIVTCGE